MRRLALYLTYFLAGAAIAHGITDNHLNSRVGGAHNDEISLNCQRACSELRDAFGSSLHYPNGDNFTIWDAKQQEVYYACRIQPMSSVDVAQTLRILVNHTCQFAVKGGGHSRNPNDSNSVCGVTIDLAQMNGVEVLQNGDRARIGGGATTIQGYRALEAHNLSFVGGRVDTVGIGGFTLGGGTSPFSNKFGWALDNVFEYEIVLANSTIVIVSETQNNDLFWALRGGSNNFGIVTSFIVRTFPQGPLFSSVASYGQNQTDHVLDQAYDLFVDRDLADDPDMGYEISDSYHSLTDTFSLGGTQRYLRPILNPPIFRDIDQVRPVTRTTTIDWMSNLVSSAQPMGTIRHLFGTISVMPSRAILPEAIRIFREEVRAIENVAGFTPFFVSYPLQRNAITAMKQRGGNALGINQDDPLFLILISSSWANAECDDVVTHMTDNILRRIKAAAQSLGVAHGYLYVNYAQAGQADEVFAGYGKGNAERLREIQRSVDPNGIFTSKGLWTGFMKLQ